MEEERTTIRASETSHSTIAENQVQSTDAQETDEDSVKLLSQSEKYREIGTREDSASVITARSKSDDSKKKVRKKSRVKIKMKFPKLIRSAKENTPESRYNLRRRKKEPDKQ